MKPNRFLANRSGIYGIRNLVNNKIYVGRTSCFYRRCHQYVYGFLNRRLGDMNTYLFNSIFKNGLDNFEFFVLEFAPIEDLPDLELKWMNFYRSFDRNRGYNLNIDSGTVRIVNEETSKKISDSLKKQWADGLRSEHGNKIKEVWKNKNKEEQNRIVDNISKMKTRYNYKLEKDDVVEYVLYKKLKEMKLQNVISAFWEHGTNTVVHKGYKITRFHLGEEYNEN